MIDPNLQRRSRFSPSSSNSSRRSWRTSSRTRSSPVFRVPRRHTPLDPLSDHVGLDPANDPYSLSRNLFVMEWDSLPGYSSYWHLHALRLPSGERVYWVDDANGRRIIALGPGGVGADERFARVLFASNGEKFGTGIIDSAPSRISTSLRGELLTDLFLTALNLSANGWNDLDGVGRAAVRTWLKKTLTKGGKELQDPKLPDEGRGAAGVSGAGGGSRLGLHSRTPRSRRSACRAASPRLFPLAKSLRKKIHPLADSVSYQLFQFAWWSVPGSTFIQQISAILLPDQHSRVLVFP